MPDILHDLPIRATRAEVWRAVATPAGLDAWWTLDSEGEAREGSDWRFGFGPEFRWWGRVVEYEPWAVIAWEMTFADADWTGTRVSLALEEVDGTLRLRFEHTGWKEANDHFRTTSCCWAQYLRLLRQLVETGRTVPYARRLDD